MGAAILLNSLLPLRLILMGTGAFAVPAFRALFASSHTVAAVVTRPVPAPRGRHKGPVNPVREAFESFDVRWLDPVDVNEPSVQSQLGELRPDLFVVCDYGQILSRDTLRIARLGGLNLHGSLLPKYRGAAPVNWAIWNGDAETGVTVIHMTPKLDGGPCLAIAKTPIGLDDDAPALEHRLSVLGVEPICQALAVVADWDGQSPLGSVQNPIQATRAPRLKKSDGAVDWTQPAARICCQTRALRPWPGTYTYWLRGAGPLLLLLEKVSVVPASLLACQARPGEVVSVSNGAIAVATGEGFLAIEQLKPAGKRVLEAAEFLRGYPVRPGDRFGNEAVAK